MHSSARWFSILTGAVVGGLTLVAPALQAQAGEERRAWSITAMAGVLDFDFADDDFGLYAIRADRPIGEWVRLEFDTSLSRAEVQTDANGVFDPAAPEENTTLSTVTIGLQGRIRTSYFEPYVGILTGIFWRRDDDSDGVRQSQTTVTFPAGVRVFLGDRFGLRAEVRFRRDQTAFDTDTNIERTVGISWTF